MAPLAPNNTARFRFHYTTVGQQHTLQIRSAASPAVAGQMWDALLTSLSTFMHSITLNFVDFAPSGSDIFNPVTTGEEGNSWGSGAGADFNTPWAITFVGRTSGGRRIRWAIFGATTLSGNYRVDPGDSVLVDAGIATLQGFGGNVLGIDGLTPVWYDYANIQVNDHWVKEIR